ncbi:hypothetical protein K7887_22015 (plasmid) [Sutcliffiella horikoshii]|uniref:hypothetical protein n=1 Tax=Sutcliffiella horikoshii TaxID=79883 RepID=UPI001CBB6D2E|nr:hypothetical protein [Sutcliffiella horikoshii]UAL49743.1 hypothetical protein K7887_22015 [Sutcliffiella horikoshii]
MNEDLRKAKGKLPAWLIAAELGVHENTVFRMFRSSLSPQKKKEILGAIENAKRKVAANES